MRRKVGEEAKDEVEEGRNPNFLFVGDEKCVHCVCNLHSMSFMQTNKSKHVMHKAE